MNVFFRSDENTAVADAELKDPIWERLIVYMLLGLFSGKAVPEAIDCFDLRRLVETIRRALLLNIFRNCVGIRQHFSSFWKRQRGHSAARSASAQRYARSNHIFWCDAGWTNSESIRTRIRHGRHKTRRKFSLFVVRNHGHLTNQRHHCNFDAAVHCY